MQSIATNTDNYTSHTLGMVCPRQRPGPPIHLLCSLLGDWSTVVQVRCSLELYMPLAATMLNHSTRLPYKHNLAENGDTEHPHAANRSKSTLMAPARDQMDGVLRRCITFRSSEYRSKRFP